MTRTMDKIETEFIEKAKAVYGSKGKRQAEKIVKQLHAVDCEPCDFPFIQEAMIETFWNAKQYNQRFTNKRYQKKEASQ